MAWEGDTLVVDVTGFNGQIWLTDGRDKPTPTSSGVWFTSDAMHQTERWRLIDVDTLEYQVTVEDPKMLIRPWTSPKQIVKRGPPEVDRLGEGVCVDPVDYYAMSAVRDDKK